MSSNSLLDGLKVIDLSRVLAGPWVTQTLADLGADVIKIERPDGGDDTRSWGPPYFEKEDGSQLSAYFMSANRGKKSIAINIASEAGQNLILELVKEADVFVENFKVGDMKKKGLDYETLSSINPGLIYCSITGFGQTGPYKDRPGYDFMIQGMSGLMSITGESDEHPGAGPQKVGVALADILTGLYSTNAILAAVNERHTSGLGQHIDMALLDVMAAALANQASNYLVSGDAPTRIGNAHPNIVPYQTFASSDGHFIVAVGNNSQFSRLCELIDRTDLSKNPDYVDNEQRVKNRQNLVAELEAAFLTRTTVQWLKDLEAAGVPFGPINDIEQMFADEQVKARNVEIDMDGMPLVGNPIKFSRSVIRYDRRPPSLGQDTIQVLADELGLDDEQILKLKELGVVSSRP
jgi:formyl-CoA transferase